MGKKKRCHELEGLEQKNQPYLLKVAVHKDEKGEYIEWCNLSWHRAGIDSGSEICERRSCQNYRKLYIPKN